MNQYAKITLAMASSLLTMLAIALALALTGGPAHAALPTGGSERGAQQSSAPLNDAYASLLPCNITVSTGQTVTLDLMINAGSHAAVAQQSYLSFNSSLLQVVNPVTGCGNPVTTVQADTGVLDLVFQNQVDNAAGRIAFASGTFGAGGTGSFRVARVTFCSTGNGVASLNWEFAAPRSSGITDESGVRIENQPLYQDCALTNPFPATSTPTATQTNTATSTSTRTSTGTATQTGTNTATNTPQPTNTATSTPANTATRTATNTAVPPTNTATSTSTSIPTNTPQPTNTATSTAVPPTFTATNTAAPTSTSTNTHTVTVTVTATATPDCTLNPNYLVTPSTGATIVPATNYILGSTCNACTVNIPLPFTYSLYDTPYTSVNASNKGNLQFITNIATGVNACLPAPALGDAIFAYWDDLNTNINDTMGIYTSVSGVAPNRIFNIEWRAGFVANDTRPSFEVRLYEGQPKFEVIYGQTRNGFSATIGVQKADGTRSTQYSCNTNGTVQSGLKLTFDRTTCPSMIGVKR